MDIREIVVEEFNLNVKNLRTESLKGVFRGNRGIGTLLSLNPPRVAGAGQGL